MQSDEIGQFEQALCSNVDGVPSAMAALAVSTATELGRWQPTTDFRVRAGELALTRAGKRQCEDGRCWNTQAILDLQRAPDGAVVIGGEAFDGESFRQSLLENFREQSRCAPGDDVRGACTEQPHELELASTESGACDTVFTFHATTPRGRPLRNPAQLANQLVYVGYPENEYLSFTSTSSTVSIDPTYGLNDTADASAGSCSAACTKISSTDISGHCCSCSGSNRTYSRSSFSATLYLCN